MLMLMRRVLSFPLPKHQGKLPIAQIKERMAQAMQDVDNIHAARLQYKIGATRNVNDLWMLRSDMYQLIATRHSESEAARRINNLSPSFSQWIPAKQLTTF